MRILALDTATEGCSVALHTDGGVIGVFEEVGRGHAEVILGMVDRVLAEAGTSLRLLDGIAASVGPGSFTGVRISVSVAQGLAFGADLPVVAVTTLEALALQALERSESRGASQVVACLDARMDEVYWGAFAADARRGVAALVPLAVAPAAAVAVPGAAGAGMAAAPCLGIGRGFAAYPALARLPHLVVAPGASDALPDARDMARLGALRFAAGEGGDAATLAPLYLRDKVALTERERAAVKRVASAGVTRLTS